MSEFRNLELRRLDLMVLLVFLGLLRQRKAALVAEQLGVTPSTISHALQRLRDVFGDPLFLRRPHGLEPTDVALQLEAPVRAAVEALDSALAGPQAFDPASSTATLTLTGYDGELATLVPGLAKRLLTVAPGMRLIARALGRAQALAALDDGSVDLALGVFPHLGRDNIADPLLRDGFAVVLRADDPRATDTLTLEGYLAARHLVVSPGGDLQGLVDDLLAARGLSRQVVIAAPLFLPALAMVAETGVIATVPSRIARRFAPAFGLVVQDAPLPIHTFEITAARHRRNARNPMLEWVVTELQTIGAA